MRVSSATKTGALDNRFAGRGAKARIRAFTLIELLIVIAIIAILASMLLPVLDKAKVRGQEANCINNQKQLITAWVMYATDNSDYCVGNEWHDEKAMSKNENWLSGWLDPGSATTDNTNISLFIDPTYATLADYTKIAKLYLCPPVWFWGPFPGAIAVCQSAVLFQ